MKTLKKNIKNLIPILLLLLFGIGSGSIVSQVKNVGNSQAQESSNASCANYNGNNVPCNINVGCGQVSGKIVPNTKLDIVIDASLENPWQCDKSTLCSDGIKVASTTSDGEGNFSIGFDTTKWGGPHLVFPYYIKPDGNYDVVYNNSNGQQTFPMSCPANYTTAPSGDFTITGVKANSIGTRYEVSVNLPAQLNNDKDKIGNYTLQKLKGDRFFPVGGSSPQNMYGTIQDISSNFGIDPYGVYQVIVAYKDHSNDMVTMPYDSSKATPASTPTTTTPTTTPAPITTTPTTPAPTTNPAPTTTTTPSTSTDIYVSPVVPDPPKTAPQVSGSFTQALTVCGTTEFYVQQASKVAMYLDGDKSTGKKFFEGSLTDAGMTDRGGVGAYGGRNYQYKFDEKAYPGMHLISGYAIASDGTEKQFSNSVSFFCASSSTSTTSSSTSSSTSTSSDATKSTDDDTSDYATTTSTASVSVFGNSKESLNVKKGDTVKFTWSIEGIEPVNCFNDWSENLSGKTGEQSVVIEHDYDRTYFVVCHDPVSKNYLSDSVKVLVTSDTKVQTDEEKEKEAKINTTNYLVIPEKSPVNCDETPENKFHGCYYNGIIEDLVYYPPMENVIGGEYIDGDVVNHEWGYDSLITDMNGEKHSDNVSAIWRGRFYFEDGYYTFHSVTDDGMKVNVEGLGDILYKWYPQPRNAHNSDVYRIKSGWKTVTVRYFDKADKATAKFWWDKESDLEDAAIQTQLSTFQQLITDLQDIIDKILKFLGIK